MAEQVEDTKEAGSRAVSGSSASGAKRGSSEAIDEAAKDSFPASDPPASHLPDEPPVNADAKWKAARAAKNV